MAATETTAPIVMSLSVPLPPVDAFGLFTERMGTWWPIETHSVGKQNVTDVLFETRLGGGVYEVQADGSRSRWAEILAWDPPHRFVMSWQPNPGRSDATEVEVGFSAEGAGTRVTLEHRAWERLGADAAESRSDYANGWVKVLGLFEAAADAA